MEKQEKLLAKALRTEGEKSQKVHRKFEDFEREGSKHIGSKLLDAPLASNLNWPAHAVHKGENKGEPLSTEAVRDFKKLLLSLDHMVATWINKHGGDFHPCSLAYHRSQIFSSQKAPQGSDEGSSESDLLIRSSNE